MQEEVESKSVNLAVRTTTVTARVLYQALRSYMQDTKNMVANSRARAQTRQQMKLTKQQIKAAGKNTPVRGKQTVKQLMSHGQNVDCTDISKEDIKDFKRVANKYGLDFAIVKDKQSERPMYTVFFKARDDKVLEKVMDHFAMKEIILDGKEEKVKPSIRRSERSRSDEHKEIKEGSASEYPFCIGRCDSYKPWRSMEACCRR